jgi:hypothetical protein
MKLNHKKITNNPPLVVNGLISVQALTSPSWPDITQYCLGHPTDLRLAKQKLWNMQDHRWLIVTDHPMQFDLHERVTRNEKPEVLQNIRNDLPLNSEAVFDVDRSVLEQEGRKCFSGAGWANWLWSYRNFVSESTRNELEHIYTVDSASQGGHVTSLFMDVSKLRTELQNTYLDNYEAFSQRRAIDNDFLITGVGYVWGSHKQEMIADIVIEAYSMETPTVRRKIVEYVEKLDINGYITLADVMLSAGLVDELIDGNDGLEAVRTGGVRRCASKITEAVDRWISASKVDEGVRRNE